MLLQHLELSHPENGESPFIARDASPLGQRKRSTSNARSRSPAGRGSRSNNLAPTSEHADRDFYVECPLRCGEAVHIRELEDHMDLHDIESQGFDEFDGAGSSRHTSPVPFGRRSSSMGRSMLDTSIQRRPSSRRSGEQLTVPDDPEPRRRREGSPLRNFKDLLLGPAPRKTRPAEAKARTGTVRRLGVCPPLPMPSA